MNNYSTSKSNFGKTAYNTLTSESYEIYTDILTADEYNYLENMFSSTAVWLFDGVDIFSVNITDTNYDFKDKFNDKAINLKISCEKTIKNYRK